MIVMLSRPEITPLRVAGRFGIPEEVADAVCWLLSSAASYVNGAVITADGAETAGLRTSRDLSPS